MPNFEDKSQASSDSNEFLTTEEIDRLFRSAERSLHRGKFDHAITIFEKLLITVLEEDSLYLNIQRGLVKAYQQNEQLDQAIALCQVMIDGNNSIASLWGSKYISNLVPDHELSVSTESKVEEPLEKSTTTFKFKTLAEFKQYCQDNLLDELKQLEKKRIETLISIAISGVICIIVNWVICQLIVDYLHLENTLLFNLTLLSIPGSIWVIFCRGCIHIYGMGFKHNIIKNMISFIDESGQLNYANQLFLEDKRQTILGFTRSQLFRDELEEPDALEQEDCVYGAIGNTDIFFAEIVAENYQKRYLNEFETTEHFGKKQIFHGLFFEARFAKTFISRTFVLPNNLKHKVSLLNNWRGEKVNLEDPEFNQMFEVYGDNQIESRYILSTNLMSRLVEFTKKAKRKVYISFVDGFVYIAIPYRHRLFEPKLLQNMTSFAPLREYFLDLQLMIGIVEDLNLNRRIWKSN